MRKKTFLKLLRIRFGEQGFELQKKSENKHLKSRFGWKNYKFFFFQKMCVCAWQGKFFCIYNQKIRKEEFYK